MHCVVELSLSHTYIAEPQPLADALQYSRDLRKRKQQDSDDWLAARKVVKRPRKKPTGFKEPTYELYKPKVKKPSTAMSKAERLRRQKAGRDRADARKRAERDGGNTSAPAPAPQKKPRAAPKKRAAHPLRAKVKEKKRRK